MVDVFLGESSGADKEADARSTEPSWAKRISRRTCCSMKGCKEESTASLKSVESSSGSRSGVDAVGMWGGGVEISEESFLFFLDTKASISQSG